MLSYIILKNAGKITCGAWSNILVTVKQYRPIFCNKKIVCETNSSGKFYGI